MANAKHSRDTAQISFLDEAIDFMRRSVDSGKPFLAYVATNTPHGPLIAKEEDEAALPAAFAQPEFAHMRPELKNRLSKYRRK